LLHLYFFRGNQFTTQAIFWTNLYPRWIKIHQNVSKTPCHFYKILT